MLYRGRTESAFPQFREKVADEGVLTNYLETCT
jgi:hypothetical protein